MALYPMLIAYYTWEIAKHYKTEYSIKIYEYENLFLDMHNWKVSQEF